jgi:hypothetical protein
MSGIHPSLHKMTRLWAVIFLLTWMVGVMLLIIAPFLRDLMPPGWPTWPVSLAGGYVMIISPILFVVMIRRYRRASRVFAQAQPQSRTVIAVEKTRTGQRGYYRVRLAEGEHPQELMRILIPPRDPVVTVGQTVFLYLDPPANQMVALRTPSEQVVWVSPVHV